MLQLHVVLFMSMNSFANSIGRSSFNSSGTWFIRGVWQGNRWNNWITPKAFIQSSCMYEKCRASFDLGVRCALVKLNHHGRYVGIALVSRINNTCFSFTVATIINYCAMNRIRINAEHQGKPNNRESERGCDWNWILTRCVVAVRFRWRKQWFVEKWKWFSLVAQSSRNLSINLLGKKEEK